MYCDFYMLYQPKTALESGRERIYLFHFLQIINKKTLVCIHNTFFFHTPKNIQCNKSVVRSHLNVE